MEKKNIKIYVAGKLSDHAIDYLKNCGIMIEYARKIRNEGFSVYVPCLDLLEVLVNPLEFDHKKLFDNSLEWLKVSDALFVIPGYKTSNGTKKEIQTAEILKIPIFYNLEELKESYKV